MLVVDFSSFSDTDMKRSKADRSTGGSQAKIPRTQPEAARDDQRPWPLKAGMILEVSLKNFMCHEVS